VNGEALPSSIDPFNPSTYSGVDREFDLQFAGLAPFLQPALGIALSGLSSSLP
jgi:hypothetical protein